GLSLPRQLATGMAEFIGTSFKSFAKTGSPEALANIAFILLPVAKYGVSGVKGVVARIRPDTLTGNALALNADVGRAQLPKGMTQMTARQLIADVESAQLVGNDKPGIFSIEAGDNT
ncbi:unnamed protein product, partial [marine sediment metagenome]